MSVCLDNVTSFLAPGFVPSQLASFCQPFFSLLSHYTRKVYQATSAQTILFQTDMSSLFWICSADFKSISAAIMQSTKATMEHFTFCKASNLLKLKAQSMLWLLTHARDVLQVHADTIGVLLPNLVQGLSTGASKDFQLATHMVLAQLCSRAVLSPALLKGESKFANKGTTQRSNSFAWVRPSESETLLRDNLRSSPSIAVPGYSHRT